MGYRRPETLSEALALAAETGGGGDPRTPAGLPGGGLIDLSALEELRGIVRVPGGWRIGACTAWAEIAAHPLPPALAGLTAAARAMVAARGRTAGMVADTLHSVLPAPGGVPPLLTLDVRIEVASTRSRRTMALNSFLIGPGQVALAPGEIMTAVLVPRTAPTARGAFVAPHDIAGPPAMVAALVWLDRRSRVAGARIAVGGMTPVAQHLPDLEAAVINLAPSALALHPVPAEHLAPLALTDPRWHEALAEMCRRALIEALTTG